MKFISHKAACIYWNEKLLFQKKNLLKLYPEYYKKWLKIDRKKDKSWSAKDFRFWLYLRKIDEDYSIARELGKRGGDATKAKLGKEHFKKISKLGVKARSEKH